MSKYENRDLRVGVIGVGQMGAHHLRVYSSLKHADCIGVYDAQRDKAEEAAKQYGCKAFANIDDLAAAVDAVTIATPSSTHAEIGVKLLSKGIHCLIEKPLATSAAECRALIDAAQKSGSVLGVGHIERFNPAVQQLKQFIGTGVDVSSIGIRRLSHADGRVKDVDVIADLMIHDVDIVHYLFGSAGTVTAVQAVSANKGAVCDHAVALLSFPGGRIATLEASRVTEHKVRELTLNSNIGYVTVNFLNQEMIIHRRGKAEALPGQDNPAYKVELLSQHIVVRKAEPLVVELANFLDAIRGRTPIGVSGADALAALQIVWEAQKRLAA